MIARDAWVRLDPRDLRERAYDLNVIPWPDAEWDCLVMHHRGVTYFALGGHAA